MMIGRDDKQASYIPTEDEIQEACERIRGSWSQDEVIQRLNAHFCDDDNNLDDGESDASSSPD